MTPGAAHVARLQRIVAAMRQRVDFVEHSSFWRLREAWFSLKRRFGFAHDPAPPAVPAPDFVEAMRTDDPFAFWILENEPRPADLRRLREWIAILPERPHVAIVVDDADPARDASDALAAARAQVYPCTVVATSTVAHASLASHDAVGRWNAAASTLDAGIVAYCTADDILAPDAAAEIVLGFLREPEAAFAFGDRDVVARDGSRSHPTFAPGWSPETFLAYPYTGGALWFRRSLAEPLRPEFGEAARYDLALRATDGGVAAVHRPRILLHERARTDAPARDPWHDAREAALRRRAVRAEFEDVVGCPEAEVVRYLPPADIRVDIVIPTRDHADDLERCLASIERHTDRRRFDVTIVDNGSVEAATRALLERWQRTFSDRMRVVRVDEPFNFSRLVNVGTRVGSSPVVLLLNNDTEVLHDGWLESLAGYAVRPEIGAVGATLLYPDGTLQHAGVVVGLGQLAGHIYRFADPEGIDDRTLRVPRNVSAVTGACLAIRREAFESVGGFDESLAVEYNDIDFCLRVGATGLRNICLPHVRLVHFESKSRGTDDTSSKRARSNGERRAFRARYTGAGYVDPFYNANLTTVDESGTFDLPAWLERA